MGLASSSILYSSYSSHASNMPKKSKTLGRRTDETETFASRHSVLSSHKKLVNAVAPFVHFIIMFARNAAVSSALRGASRVARPQTRQMGGG